MPRFARPAVVALALLLAVGLHADGSPTPTDTTASGTPTTSTTTPATTAAPATDSTATTTTATTPDTGSATTPTTTTASTSTTATTPTTTTTPVTDSTVTTPATPADAATTPSAAPTAAPAPAPVPAPTSADLDAAKARIDALTAQIAELAAKLDKAEGDLAASEKQLAATQSELQSAQDSRAADAAAADKLQSDLIASTDEANTQVAELKTKLADRDQLADQLAALEAEKDRLSSSLDAEREGRFDLAEWPVVLVSGFADAKPRIGSWKLSDTKAVQTNPREFFSRLDIPLEQSGKAFLYRFTARSTGQGWVGLGIHFFASDVKSKRGYGEGRSLLVWLTRDPAVRKTDATWLQLYRSDTDVEMERVLDSKLEQAIDDKLSVEVAYDPASGYVTVAVDGKLAVKYRAWFGIDEGVGVSLRTLGAGASFSDFEVRAAE